jgi:O-antigen ligase
MKVITSLAIGASVCVGIWHVMDADAYETIAHRYSIEALQAGDFSSRPKLAVEAASIFFEHPVVGAGLDGFYALSGYASGIDHAHNYFLSVAADGGLLGLGLLTAAAFWLWRGGRPWSRRAPEICGSMLAAIYVAGAGMFSGDYYDSRFIWIFAAVLAASRRNVSESGPSRSE